jgi:amino acid adenylation domain-containing protein
MSGGTKSRFGLSTEKKALLAKTMRERGINGAKSEQIIIEPRADRNRSQLSYAQERLWFIEQLFPGNPSYNIPVVIRMRGTCDVELLCKSMRTLSRRHEILWCRVANDNGQPYLDFSYPTDLSVNVVDLRIKQLELAQQEAKMLAQQEASRPFDLEQAPLWRVTLIQLTDNESWLVWTMHHIISEAWSYAILFKEMSAIYRGEILGDRKLDFGDYCNWQRKVSVVKDSHLAFWKKYLAGELPVLELPTDHPRKAVRSMKGNWEAKALSSELSQQIKKLANQQNATIFMVMLAAFKLLLHRYTGLDDIIVGSPVTRRNRSELEQMVGFFINTIAIRSDLGGNPSFIELLGRVRETSLEAFSYQDVPFEKVVEAIQPERNLNSSPIFQVAMVYQNTPIEGAWRNAFSLPGISHNMAITPSQTAKFDLTLEVEHRGTELWISMEYDTDLFEQTTVKRLLTQLECLLHAACSDPNQQLSNIPLMEQAERERILRSWNGTTAKYPADIAIHKQVELQADRRPDAVAISFSDKVLSYQELDQWANAVAKKLLECGISTGEPVALYAEQSPWLIVGMLGILKAGGAYLPIDPKYPIERQKFILGDAGATLLVMPDHVIHTLNVKVSIVMQSLSPEVKRCNITGVNGESLAYIMYTSGSSGKPKGVLSPHRGISRLLFNTNYVTLGEDDVIPQLGNPAFDATTFEIWGALVHGGRVRIVPVTQVLDPTLFKSELIDSGATLLFITTALFNQVAAVKPDAFATLKQVFVGGEALDPQAIRKVLVKGPGELCNIYGPTEITTFATWHVINEAHCKHSIPIGRPINNTSTYVLDAYQQPVPVGMPGELYIGGPGVAKGYLNRSTLTEQHFIQDPFNSEGYLYRTGDQVKWFVDGTLDFIGRIDSQIKLRGFRIELGEIEFLLAQHKGVSENVVTVIKNTTDSQLVAYVVGQNLNVAELKEYLARQLPPYMVPATCVVLDSMPINANGKIDHGALPGPDFLDVVNYIAPRNNIEKKLVEIWCEVLGLERIGVYDDFFDIGGHSLKAVQVFRQIGEHFGEDLPLALLFRKSTIASLAERLRLGESDSKQGLTECTPMYPATSMRFGPLKIGKPLMAAAFDPVVPIQRNGNKTPLFCVHGAGGNVLNFKNIADGLDKDQPFFGIQAIGVDGVREPLMSIQDMAGQYVVAIKRWQNEGPYRLGGYSGGGVIAFEMAQQLRSQNEDVELLFMLDVDAGPEKPEKFDVKSKRRLSQFRSIGFRWIVERMRSRLAWYYNRANLACASYIKIVGLPYPLTLRERLLNECFSQARYHYTLRKLANVFVVVFQAEDGTIVDTKDETLGWKQVVGGDVKVYSVPGDHGSLMIHPNVDLLTGKLTECLNNLAPVATEVATDCTISADLLNH